MRADIVNTNPSAPAFDRREFLVTSILAAGTFAAAVSPIQAQTRIVTDDKGLTAGEVKIPAADGEIPAYRAMPEKGKKFPVVLIVHEIFGVHEWIQDMARRFAKQGYMAVAPSLHARQGEVKDIKDIRQIINKIFAKIPDGQVMSDLDATVAWAGKNKGNTDKLSITGYCWGGRIVWLYAAHNPKVDAGAAFYGRVATSPNSSTNTLQPNNPIDFARDLKVPVIGFYGGKDTGIPVEGVRQMETELKKGKSGSEIVIYPDAGHGFLADYRESYNKPAAEDAWKRTLDWFKSHGAA